MKERLISKIRVVYNQGCVTEEVGVDGITKIVDCSLEHESSIHAQYDIYAGDKLVRTFQNCPVDIQWKL